MPTNKPFRAKRNEQQIELVIIEKPALLFLTSLGRSMLDAGRAQADVQVDRKMTDALEAAVFVAEHALELADGAIYVNERTLELDKEQ